MASLPMLLFLARIGGSSSWSWESFAIVLAIIGGFVWLSFYPEKKRAEALRKVAEELRLEYLGGAGVRLEELAPFWLCSRGHGRELRNVMTGRAGVTEVAIFDYAYTVGTGKSSTTYRQTVVRFCTEGWRLPAFVLRPEGLLSKLGSMFGGQDIDFASHPVFSKMFVLKGSDEAAIRACFNETLLTALEGRKGIWVEGHGKTLLFYRASKRVKPPEIRALLEEAHGVYAHFADAVAVAL